MSRVDFYILSEGNAVDRFVCNITAKAWSMGNQVHIHTRSDEQANMMDKLLWTYHDISFIPHELFDLNSDQSTPITIGFGEHYPDGVQVMINLDQTIPEFVNHFERVVEIVGGNETDKQLARQRYKVYKAGDYEIHDHKIDSI